MQSPSFAPPKEEGDPRKGGPTGRPSRSRPYTALRGNLWCSREGRCRRTRYVHFVHGAQTTPASQSLKQEHLAVLLPAPLAAFLGTARGDPWLGPWLRSARESAGVATLRCLGSFPTGGRRGWGLSERLIRKILFNWLQRHVNKPQPSPEGAIGCTDPLGLPL